MIDSATANPQRTRAASSTLLLFGVCLLAAPSARSQQRDTPFTVTLSPNATSIHWTLNTTLHTVHGTFRLSSGSFRIDPATGDALGRIVIDATSGESGDAARDRRMHSTVLESGSFPEITYRPTHVSGRIDLAAGCDITIDGTLHLHSTDHPKQLIVHLQPAGSAARLTTHFIIPYVAWGLKDPSTFILRTGKQVALDIDATFTSTPERGPAKADLHPGEVHTAR